MSSERRRHNRVPVSWAARCIVDSETYWNATIVDASEGGFGLSRDLPLEIDERLAIAIADVGTFPCRVAWKSSTKCGVELEDEEDFLRIDEADLLASALLETTSDAKA